MILDIYKDSLEYSAKDWKTLVILGVICFFSFLLLPAFLITGYNYRVINTAVHGVINGRDPLPDFEDLISMFVDGVKFVIVQILYLLVPAIIFLIFALVAGQTNGVAASAIMIIGCIITFVAFVVAELMAQMGICHMAYNDGAFSKAFAISEIKEVIDEIGWFECIATFLGLIIITLVILFVVSAIIGIIFTAFGLSTAILGINPSSIYKVIFMASITDCVVEGLKYPFNDIKKLLGVGILCVIIDLISIVFTIKTVDVTKMIIGTLEKTNATGFNLNFSQLPNGDIYLAIAMLVVGFIVSLFIMGYQYDVVNFSINRKDDLPGFGDIVGMFIKGVKYFLVCLVYSIPSMIVAFLAILVSNNSSLWSVIMVISVLLIIICYFILIMALNNMIAHDSLKKAFDFSEIRGNISNLGWVKYIGTILFTVIVFMIINIAIGIVMSFLTVIFAATINNQAIVISIVISVIEALFVTSYCSVFFSRVCGSIYREAVK